MVEKAARARLTLALLIAGFMPSGSLAAQASPSVERAIAIGRTYTRWFLAGRLDSLYVRMAPGLKTAVGGREGLERLAGTVMSQAGAEDSVLSETTYNGPGMTEYYRVSRFEQLPDSVTLTTRWVWAGPDTLDGATIGPTRQPASSEFLGYQTRADLRLPFEPPPDQGHWYVAWGGRTVQENYHAVAPDQRFAYDFMIVDEGATHRGVGRYNEDYHCYGVPILAPAAGTVVTAVDSVPENSPGNMNAAAPPGNYVVIDHGEGEYSLLAHLRRGSVRVRPGNHIGQGVMVGECGNSGNSSEPHLHYHLQTAVGFGEGVGLPAQFQDYSADGIQVDRGEPVRGEEVEP